MRQFSLSAATAGVLEIKSIENKEKINEAFKT
jgi:hypothetical protein